MASYETNNPEQSLKVLATSDEPWAVKFRKHLKKAHGLDIGQSSSIWQPNGLIIIGRNKKKFIPHFFP